MMSISEVTLKIAKLLIDSENLLWIAKLPYKVENLPWRKFSLKSNFLLSFLFLFEIKFDFSTNFLYNIKRKWKEKISMKL